MQAIKCELCGSNQLIKKDGYYQCEFCGTKYTLEEAKKLIVSGTVEVVTGNAEKERLIKNANTYLQLSEYGKAIEIYNKIQAQFPDDYRGWWGEFTTQITWGAFSNIDYNSLYNALKLCNDKSIFIEFFNDIIKNYGNNLHIIKENNVRSSFSRYELKVYDENLNEICPLIIDEFTFWLIFDCYKIFEFYNFSDFKKFIESLTNDYVNKIFEGNVTPYAVKSKTNNFRYDFPKPPMYTGEWNFNYFNGINLNDCDYTTKEYRRFVDSLVSYFNKFSYNATKNTHWNAIHFERIKCGGQPRAIFGKWIYLDIACYDIENYLLIKLPTLFTKNDMLPECFTDLHLCQNCGGKFKGIFNQVCSKCGKPKDY